MEIMLPQCYAAFNGLFTFVPGSSYVNGDFPASPVVRRFRQHAICNDVDSYNWPPNKQPPPPPCTFSLDVSYPWSAADIARTAAIEDDGGTKTVTDGALSGKILFTILTRARLATLRQRETFLLQESRFQISLAI